MYQGTTPMLLLEVDADLTGMTVQVSFRSATGQIFEKAAPDVEIYPDEKGSIISVVFSQEETFQIPEGVCQVEVRWVDETGIADISFVGSVDVIGSMTKNVITYRGGEEA